MTDSRQSPVPAAEEGRSFQTAAPRTRLVVAANEAAGSGTVIAYA